MKTTDKEVKNSFLETSGDGSRDAVVQSLLSKRGLLNNSEKPKICRVERSPLLAKLQSFIPSLAESNTELENMSEEELAKLRMENIGDNEEKVINLSVLQADDMQDSPIFKALSLSQSLKSDELLKTLTGASQLNDSSSESETDDEDGDKFILEATSSKKE